MRRRAAGRRDGAAVVAGLLLLHASCQLQTQGTADETRADASLAGAGGSGGHAEAGPDVDTADATPADSETPGDAQTGDGPDAEAGLACGVNPAPPGGPVCPGQCNGGCFENKCRINCFTGLLRCAEQLRCPDGFDCEVACFGTGSCAKTRLQCDPAHRCGMLCDGPAACHEATVQCGSGSCGLLCINGGCLDATLDCGSGDCIGVCVGPPYPVVNCSDSCSCTPC